MVIALSLVAAYLIGSIPFAFLLTRHVRGIDLRTTGSGNPGATNVMRSAGPRLAAAVVALDVVKGTIAVLIASDATPAVVPAAAGMAAIIGHVYPVWLRFRGGKGVATAFGVFSVLAPLATVLCLLGFVGTVWITRYVSLGSVVATAALGPLMCLTHAPTAVIVAAFVAAALIIERHRTNLARLQAGTERRLGQRV
jgi:glycerol-3-phosphate acyltransferase PlsY